MDQGSHLIDLVNYFCGNLKLHSAYTDNLYWHSNLEDLAFVILKGKNMVANLSATCIEWKNVFMCEIILKRAKIQIDGLGKSYGREKLTLYTMNSEMGPPMINEFSFQEEDLSWKRENNAFFKRIRFNDISDKSLNDAIYVMNIVKKVYSQNKL